MRNDSESERDAGRPAPLELDRRSFLRTASLAVGASLLARDALAEGIAAQQAKGKAAKPATQGRQLQVIGIQLYTLRTILPKNVRGTLQQLHRIGYREVELADTAGKTPREFRAILDSVGLKAPSAHIPLDQLRADLQRVIDDSLALGQRFIVCPSTDEKDRTVDGYKKIAADLSKAGRQTKKAGLQLCYHNHDFEFHPLANGGGKTGYDILLGESDPESLKMELDLFWATKAGRDPVALFAKYPGRFPLVHVKDMSKAGVFADVGSGTIDFARIFAKSDQAGIKHWFVEHDEPTSPLETARASFNYLRDLRF